MLMALRASESHWVMRPAVKLPTIRTMIKMGFMMHPSHYWCVVYAI
jgi:hypothetical protein